MSENTSTDATLPPRDALRRTANKLAGTDLTQYYSLLFIPRAERAALTALYAFWNEVREIPHECSDPQVAGMKLAWWHEEVDHLFAGQPRHPLGPTLSAVIAAYRLPQPPLSELIDALAQHAHQSHYTTYGDLRRHALTARGNIERLAAHIMGCRHPDTPALAAEVGAALELTTLLQNIGLHARRGRCYLPHEDLADFGVEPASVLAGKTSAALGKLLVFAAARVQAELQERLARLPAADRSRLIPLRVASDIADALLPRVGAQGERILHARAALQPLRQLWIAWRTARRAKLE